MLKPLTCMDILLSPIVDQILFTSYSSELLLLMFVLILFRRCVAQMGDVVIVLVFVWVDLISETCFCVC